MPGKDKRVLRGRSEENALKKPNDEKDTSTNTKMKSLKRKRRSSKSEMNFLILNKLENLRRPIQLIKDESVKIHDDIDDDKMMMKIPYICLQGVDVDPPKRRPARKAKAASPETKSNTKRRASSSSRSPPRKVKRVSFSALVHVVPSDTVSNPSPVPREIKSALKIRSPVKTKAALKSMDGIDDILVDKSDKKATSKKAKKKVAISDNESISSVEESTNSTKSKKKTKPKKKKGFLKLRLAHMQSYTCDHCDVVFLKNIDLQLHLMRLLDKRQLKIPVYRHILPTRYTLTDNEENKYLKKIEKINTSLTTGEMTNLVEKYAPEMAEIVCSETDLSNEQNEIDTKANETNNDTNTANDTSKVLDDATTIDDTCKKDDTNKEIDTNIETDKSLEENNTTENDKTLYKESDEANNAIEESDTAEDTNKIEETVIKENDINEENERNQAASSNETSDPVSIIEENTTNAQDDFENEDQNEEEIDDSQEDPERRSSLDSINEREVSTIPKKRSRTKSEDSESEELASENDAEANTNANSLDECRNENSMDGFEENSLDESINENLMDESKADDADESSSDQTYDTTNTEESMDNTQQTTENKHSTEKVLNKIETDLEEMFLKKDDRLSNQDLLNILDEGEKKRRRSEEDQHDRKRAKLCLDENQKTEDDRNYNDEENLNDVLHNYEQHNENVAVI